MKHSAKDLSLILIFTLLTCLPFLVWPLLQPALEGENTENRNLTEAPAFSLQTVSEYPAAFEGYLNDHMPFRSLMIQGNNALKYHVFHTSSNDNVIIGKNGWLFYAAENSPAFYNGLKRYTEEQLALMADNLIRFRDYLAEREIQLLVMIAPNKERVYAEYLPDSFGPPAEDCALNQVLTVLRERTDIPVVCPLDAILAAKEQYPERLTYHPTDTHWNSWGAYLGIREMMSGLELPFEEENIQVEVVPDEPGDLANMLNLAGLIQPGTSCNVSGYEEATTAVTEYDFFGAIRFAAPDAFNIGKLLMYRDSFCTAMAPILGHLFTESCMMHYHSVTPDLVETEKPDYVVVELVERSMDILLDLSAWFPEKAE